MKSFDSYQHLEGDPLTSRDKLELGSKFWNTGKWDNFILPFLSSDCSEMTFIDMGCNAGLFLKLAQDKGFQHVIGVDSNKEAIERGEEWRKRNNGNYQLLHSEMENCVDILPVADFTVLANSHYYFRRADWLKYLENIQLKSRYCIIVTAKKRPDPKYAASDIESIRAYFKNWKEIGFVDIPPDGTPHSRHMSSLCFENPLLQRIPINCLDNGNAQQRGFLTQIDNGRDPLQTSYYKRLKSYRNLKSSKQTVWSDEKLIEYMRDRVLLYEDIKKNGLKMPLIVNPLNSRITDGNHRLEILMHLGYKSVICKT